MDYLLIGHVTADLVADGRVLGGTVSYAAPIAAVFGHHTRLLTSAATSETLVAPLLQHTALCIHAADKTTTFENIYQDNHRTQYVHHLAAPLTAAMIPQGWTDSPLVHLAPLVAEIDLTIAQQFADATVLLTPQGFLREWDADGLVGFKRWLDADFLQYVNILVLSTQDIVPAPELALEYAQIVEHVIVTDGANGGSYYHYGEAHHYQSHRADEIDPTGAGDVFASSLLASLPLLDFDMHKALQVAAQLAAISVTHKGTGYPFTSQQIQQILAQYE